MRQSRKLSIILSLILAFSLTSCLKTRSQIRGGGDDSDSSPEEIKASPQKGARYEMEELKTELSRISGKLEEVEHTQRNQNAAELKEYSTRLEARISELEKNQTLLLTEMKALKDKDTAERKEAATPPSDLFNEGHRLLKQRNFEEAAEKFHALLNKGVKGKDLAEAHFGLGEAEYGSKNYKKAIVQYSKVQEAFSKSPRVPTSLYKIGLSFQHLNMGKEAKGFFQELGERYPKSPEAKKSRAKVKE